MDLQKRLLLAMRSKGECQAELARCLGCHRSQITQWTTGARKPSVDNLAAIAVALDVSTDWLLGLTDLRETEQLTKTFEGLEERDRRIVLQVAKMLSSI